MKQTTQFFLEDERLTLSHSHKKRKETMVKCRVKYASKKENEN